MIVRKSIKRIIPSNIRRLGRTALFLVRRRPREFSALLRNVRLKSIYATLQCFEIFRGRRTGFTRIAVRGVPGAGIILRNGTSDFDVFRQVFLQSQYALPGVRHARFVVDAGANIGLTSAYILSRNPNARLISIEPDPENYEIAAKNLAPFADRCDVIRAALWSGEESLVVSRGTFRDGRHWATQVIPSSDSCAETVPSCTMQTLLEQFAFPHVDFLKIDIEGSELNVFRDGDISFLERTVFCAVECHDADCRNAFETAVKDYGFETREHGELTLAFRIT